jgi:hypothetical protein
MRDHIIPDMRIVGDPDWNIPRRQEITPVDEMRAYMDEVDAELQVEYDEAFAALEAKWHIGGPAVAETTEIQEVQTIQRSRRRSWLLRLGHFQPQI